MQVWCVEHDKYAGRGTAYYKVLIKPTDHQLNILRLRAMINPELSYWATRLDETCPDVEIETMLKQKKFRKEPYFTEVQVFVMDMPIIEFIGYTVATICIVVAVVLALGSILKGD